MFPRTARFPNGEPPPLAPTTTNTRTTPRKASNSSMIPKGLRTTTPNARETPPRKSLSTIDLKNAKSLNRPHSHHSSRTADFFADSENERPHPKSLFSDQHRDGSERKIRMLQQHKIESDHQLLQKQKQLEAAQVELRRNEEKIRVLNIETSTLQQRVQTLEDKLKNERTKESTALSQAAQATQRVKFLERKLARAEIELEKQGEQNKKEYDAHKRASHIPPATPPRKADAVETANLRDDIAKLQKENRLFNAKLRDIQAKHALEKRQLQSQVASLRHIPAGESQQLAETLQVERNKWNVEMDALRAELEKARAALKADGDAEQTEQVEDEEARRLPQIPDRRLSGMSDMSEAFAYRGGDDDDISIATLENMSMEIPSFYRALESYHPTDDQPGHLDISLDDLVLIRKKTSSDTWIGELNGNVGLVPVSVVEDVNGGEFESRGLDHCGAGECVH
ncbi:hypothetical protein DFS34DRAFT_621554 [Phlyctochytrium arcticum]|nr:hypothetical protein DFS34DRAFT_621554 [Phlyctochytrium arcticum]